MTLTRRHFAGAPLAALMGGSAFGQEMAPGVSLTAFVSAGQEVAAVLFTPTRPGGPMRGAGVVLLNGGGGTNNDLPRFYRDAVRMTERGYVVVMPNYLGATPEPDPRNRVRWVDLVVDCATWLTNAHGVGAGRVALMGFSRGGWLATETALTRPGFRCAVGIASGGDLAVEAIVHRPPVLLIHADADPVVAPATTRAWRRRMRDAGVPVETYVLDSGNHVFEPSEWSEIFGRAERFARPHLS
ncbi:MAG TPA: dienelactone hydrolase family protein [Brevundimonas sp.]|uniref:dienelactone hydrolase family protein n=1 Tax=Brevundimonas sp. TaxID=1871086 RepID=UPI002DEB570D|nr:dienelactone hydrolase family protein [Brevundimonas sp.]